MLCLRTTLGQDGLTARLLVVRLSSERVHQAVRQDCSFAKKQASSLRSWSSS
jgi:hypothetical protein